MQGKDENRKDFFLDSQAISHILFMLALMN